MLTLGRVRGSRPRSFFALAAIFLWGQMAAGGAAAIAKGQLSAENPHGDPANCSACHTSDAGTRDNLSFGGNISLLCQPCHDGQLAAREGHPVDLIPSEAMLKRIPSGFPLQERKLTCLTCHDVASRCQSGQPADTTNRCFLRGSRDSDPTAFCFQCHLRDDYPPFNVHDQLEADKTKTDTCLWCHTRVPDVDQHLREGTSYGLRKKAFELCDNCHSVPADHPAGKAHLDSKPSAEMQWYMSAYEMEPQMHLPFKQLLEYVRAANRAPKSIPLDERGGITCASCHNPHEKGILPSWNLRSVGAEPKKATNHRLRAHEGDVACRACHQK